MRQGPVIVDTFVTITTDCPMRLETDPEGIDVHFNESITGQDLTLRFTHDALEALITLVKTELSA
ncbi:hypothetical protein [Actinokineospora globicatena]|uniref:Uncharacterized protein n=1 Tax=Actinokineospora globicatena TaxID=103729 RepID=A0A9W6QKJ1_9PSEU|nr:hypothetical protein [Actinokineospora globicatena]MCP2300496.1 hypothetical protein [Actinokineospora globicatena]GLW81034.1 hypothetical protein Aglo01_55150 [Actinokineospora globicatena]GLW88227.1 hypothetical protein Aglo02_58660 [Actinokineospora globicatena]GLW92701.1 hypothetical protein Aglo03_35170 [Actinokineospora globicatena]